MLQFWGWTVEDGWERSDASMDGLVRADGCLSGEAQPGVVGRKPCLPGLPSLSRPCFCVDYLTWFSHPYGKFSHSIPSSDAPSVRHFFLILGRMLVFLLQYSSMILLHNCLLYSSSYPCELFFQST